MIFMSLLPESPVWLKWKGRTHEAEAASKRLLGSNQLVTEAGEAEEGLGDQEPLVATFTNEVQSPELKGFSSESAARPCVRSVSV